MKVLEFDRDFIDYENRLRKEKNLYLKSTAPGYKVKEAAFYVGFALLGCAAVLSLIAVGWLFA